MRSLRLLLVILAGLVLAACGLKQMLPTTAVLKKPETLSPFEEARPAAVVYAGTARVDLPVLPLQVFGVLYDKDLVLVSRHPSWDMHEYARLSTPSGSLWMAKDSNLRGVQTIVADRQDIREVLAEVPVPRRRGPMQVLDRGDGRDVDMELRYTNPAGDPVVVRYRGRMPEKPPGKRNGNTMGHSRQAVAAVLDISRMGMLGQKASIEIGGQPYKLKRILGILPMRFLLRQAQGGVAVASYRQRPQDGGFQLQRPAGAGELDPVTGQPGWPTARTEGWTVEDSGPYRIARFKSELSTLVYTFLDGGLWRAEVLQPGQRGPVSTLWLSPALPDLSRPFEGVTESRFRIDVGEQQGHGTGLVRARWEGPDTVVVDFLPEAPSWLASRPIRATIIFTPEGEVIVQAVRTG